MPEPTRSAPRRPGPGLARYRVAGCGYVCWLAGGREMGSGVPVEERGAFPCPVGGRAIPQTPAVICARLRRPPPPPPAFSSMPIGPSPVQCNRGGRAPQPRRPWVGPMQGAAAGRWALESVRATGASSRGAAGRLAMRLQYCMLDLQPAVRQAPQVTVGAFRIYRRDSQARCPLSSGK
jgi:hypothetical protein